MNKHLEKITKLEKRISELENLRKLEIQKHKAEERKARTKRLCSRHGLLEKYMPDLIAITDEQFEEFIRKAVNTSYGQKILAEIASKSQDRKPEQIATTKDKSNTEAEERQETAFGQGA